MRPHVNKLVGALKNTQAPDHHFLSLYTQDFFNIVLFGDVQHVYTQSGMAPATDENKDDAAQWIYGFLTQGGTDLYTAIETAFELLEESFLMPEYPKMVQIITDGK